MAEHSVQSAVSLAEDSCKEEEQPPGAEMEKSGEGSLKSVANLPAESSSSSERPRRDGEEDDLDGFPVFGADEDDWDSSSSQKGRQSEEQDEGGGQKRKAVEQSGANADGDAQESRMEEGASQNETSTSSQEPGGSSREETLYSPIMKIKDEPIDEGYDKALMQPSDISRVKEELENGEHEVTPPLDELRISSVFSVRGASDAIAAGSVAASHPPPFVAMSQATSAIKAPLMVLPAQPQAQLQTKPLAQIQLQIQPQFQSQLQTQLQPQIQLQTQLQPQLQPQLQAQLQPQLQPPPPPASIRICCSGCSKVLQKGQTAFQRKGSNQLFCSTVCLTGFNLPPAISIAPKKTCHLCLKVIGNPKDLITVPVDSSNTLKEFCSQACLTIYRSRVEGIHEEEIVRCSMCRNPGEIQHEVNHQGVLHRLCSDECFSRFRSSKRLSMSCCESCGTCTVTGNYHLVQVEDAVKKFCSPVCISTFKQKSGKRVHCPFCHEFKSVDQMLEGTNAQGVIEFFCSSRCLTNSQASRTLSGASFPCTNCQKLAIPQYHLAMPDGSIRNFCSYDCVCRFQEKLQRSPTQMNGGATVAQNTTPNTATRGPQYSNVASRPAVPPHHAPNPSAPYMTSSSQNAPSFVPTSNQNPIPPYVPASGLAAPQDNQDQQPDAPTLAPGSIRLTCKQCQKQFRSKPEVLQYKNHIGLFCSRLCCDTYKREKDIKAVCEYCKEEKVLKDITMYEHKPRAFCCEGCKLLFRHDLAKQHGGQCRTCAYCCNMTHNTIQNHFGGKLEEFCTEECMSLYTVLFYEMAKCFWCKTQGTLNENLKWDGTIKHFCNLRCVLQFCSKKGVPDQPNSNGISTAATAAQAPLSLSKDMPVIGGVVSLASALAGNTALTGALPTSNASSKIIGDASTQTDAAVNVSPHQRRMLKNKALMCKPIIEEQGIQCQLQAPELLFKTVIDENGEKVKLVPVPVPIPVPVYVPVPMHLYTQFTPVPLGLPLPVPVPLVTSASSDSAQHSVPKGSVPSQSSVEDEDAEKSKDRPVSHGDQGSTYSGDLESEARSTPFSWADPEDSSQHPKPSVPSAQIERPTSAPAPSTSPSPLDLEKDFPIASNDHGSSKEQKSPKRRKRGKRATVVEKLKEEPDLEPNCKQSFSDTDLRLSNMETCPPKTLERNVSGSLENIVASDEPAEPRMTCKSGPRLRSSSRLRSSPQAGSKPCETVGDPECQSKIQFCIYCKEPKAKLARHLECEHTEEAEVTHALGFPKGSRRRSLLLEKLCRKGGYKHDADVLLKGNGEIVPEIQNKGNDSVTECLPCQHCLAFYRRSALLRHERSCKMKMNSQSCSNAMQQQDNENYTQSGLGSSIEPTSELTSQPLATLSPVLAPSQGSIPGAALQPSLDSSAHPGISFCSEPITLSSFETSAWPSMHFNPELPKPLSLESCQGTDVRTDLAPELGPLSAGSFDPTTAHLGHPLGSESCHQPTLASSPETSLQTSVEFSNQAADGSSLEQNSFPGAESCNQTTFKAGPEAIQYPDKPCLESPVRSDPDLKLPLTPDSCLQLHFDSSPEHSPMFESCFDFMETCSPETDYPNSCQQTSVEICPEPSPQTNQTSFESCLPSSVTSSSELDPLIHPEPGPCSQPSPKTDPSPTPETGLYPSVEPSTPESHLGCSIRSSTQPNPKLNIELHHQPSLRRRYKRRRTLRSASSYNLRSRSSTVPKVSSYVDGGGNNEQELGAIEQSACGVDSGGKSDGTRPMVENSEVCSTRNSTFCQNTSSQSEMKSATEIRTKTESPSSPRFSQSSSRACSTSSNSVPSQQLTASSNGFGGRKILSKQQFCIYCKNPYTKIARHLRAQHANEKDVAHALSFPKGSKRRLLLLEQLCKKGNYQHNVEVLRKGNGEIVPKFRRKSHHSMMDYLPCQYCLAFYLRRALLKHERSCKIKINLQSCSDYLQPQGTKSQSPLKSSTETTPQPLAIPTLAPAQVPSQSSNPELRLNWTQPNFCPESDVEPNLEPLKRSNLDSSDCTGLGSDPGPGSQFGQPCPDPLSPLSSEFGQPLSPERCLEPNLRSGPEMGLQTSPVPTPESLGTVPEPIPQPTKPDLESTATSDLDFKMPLTPDLCFESTLSSSPEPSPQSSFESCLEFMKTCSIEPDQYPNTQQANLGVSPEPSPQTNRTNFEACLPSSLRSSSELDSCSQAIVQAAPETGPLPISESHHSVKWHSQPTRNQRRSLSPCAAYNLRSKLSPKPKVSPCIDKSGNGEHKTTDDAQSTGEAEHVGLESTQSSSSCQNTGSQSEMGVTTGIGTKAKSPSSPSSIMACDASPDAKLFQQLDVNKAALGGHKLLSKQQLCIYCKKLCTKVTRHLMLQHAKEPDVAHALSFRKGSKRRLLLLEKLRNQGNYLHNVEVLQSGSGELITNKRTTVDHSWSEYLPCQHCLAFFVGRDLWRHERTCKMRKKNSSGFRKRTRTASSKLLPLHGYLPGACEEIFSLMRAGDVLDHIKEDSLIRKYGDRLFVKHGRDKKGHAYISQRMRELGRFMLAVKELDPSVQHLQQMFNPSRFDLAINCAKKISGFDECSKKLKTPYLALNVGYSIRHTAEILWGEMVMNGDAKTAANVKEFIGLVETNWISCVKDGDHDSPEGSGLEACLDNPAMVSSMCQEVVHVESVLRTEEGTSSLPDISPQPVAPNVVDVECKEREPSPVMEPQSDFCPAQKEPDDEEPSKSPDPAPWHKSRKKVEVDSKFSSFSCLKVTTQVSSAKVKANSGKKVKTGGARRVYDRKQFCVYCQKPTSKIARHLGMKHAKEKDVAHALSFPKGSKTRQHLLQQLRNKGNYQHNIKVLQNGNGEILPLKRPKKSTSLNDYKACPDCLGFYLKSESCRHHRSCKMKNGKNSSRKKWARSSPTKAFVLHDCLSEVCRDIVRCMRDDDISKQVRTDVLICKFGNKICEKRELLRSQHSYMSQRMRELGRFMLAVKELDPSVEDLRQVCTESRFDLALEAAKKVGCFDQHSNKFKTALIASKLGYSLKQATEIALGEDMMEGESAAQARKFIELLETDWVTYISSHSCNVQSPASPSQEDVAGLADDLLKLHDFLRRAEEQRKEELVENPNREAWKKLRNSLLGTVTLFNRGQKSSVDKILLEHYQGRTKEPYSGDKWESLTKVQQCLNDKLIKIQSPCRDGSTTPVLLTERMESSLDVLNKYREQVGVPADNHYLFPRMEASTHARATNCLKDFAQSCGANKPESFTSVHTHKCVGTIFQILSLSDGEMRHVAELLGGGSNWEKLNESPQQLAEVCNLLLKVDHEAVPHGESSHGSAKVTPSARKHTVIGGERTPKGPGTPKDKRRRWHVEEQEAVRKHMAEYISLLKVPGKRDCLDCIKAEPDALKSRTWRDVKYYVYNTIQSCKKRTKPMTMEADSDGEDHGGGSDAKDATADTPQRKRGRPRRV